MKKIFFSPIVFFVFAVQQVIAQDITDLYQQTSEMHGTLLQYEADRDNICRFYGSSSQPDWWSAREGNSYNSPERRNRLLQLIDTYRLQLKQLPFEKMNVNGQVDYILFRTQLEDEAYRLQQEQGLYQKVLPYFSFGGRVYELEKSRRRGASVSGEAVAREMDSIRKMILQSMEKLKAVDSMDSKQAECAAETAKGLQLSLKNYYSFYNGYDPLFSWWVPKTYTAVDSLLTVYGNSFRSKKKAGNWKDDGSGIQGNPIGREELIRQLQLEFIPYTPEELVAIANKEFAWCDSQLLKASRDMGFGDNWRAAQEKVKNSYVPPGQQPEAMLKLYNESIDFLKKNDLLTIPPLAEETWRMYMMSPERQLMSPFFLGGESLLISYPTNTMTYEDKLMSMRGNNPYFSRATVHHELIAGHHLQGFMAERYKAYRHFETPFWIEGNSLYWELLLWDMGFARSPEERIGMLFWRMHRCARIIFSLNYHLGKWSPQQCIDFLVDRVGHERANAEGEVRRSFTGGYGPLYQIAYLLGGLQFYALKKELVDTGRMSYKQYHDAILRENSLPIEMLRAILTRQPLTREYKSGWKFYGK